MTSPWIFIAGLGLLTAGARVIASRIPREYRDRQRPTLLSLAIVWAFLGTHFALVVLAAIQSTWRLTIPQPLAITSGGALLIAGTAVYLCAIYAYRSFRRMQGLDTTRLVTEGIYAWSRNPQAVGWTLVVVGVGLIRHSAMVLFLAVALWAAFRLYLPVEEELLRHLFGDAYETYRRRTHRYFGPPRPSDST